MITHGKSQTPSVVPLWWLSLGLSAVVAGVVATELGLIIAAARRIDEHAEGIWTTGKQIAGHTVAIWMFEEAGKQLNKIQESVGSLERSVAALDGKLRVIAGTSPREE